MHFFLIENAATSECGFLLLYHHLPHHQSLCPKHTCWPTVPFLGYTPARATARPWVSSRHSPSTSALQSFCQLTWVSSESEIYPWCQIRHTVLFSFLLKVRVSHPSMQIGWISDNVGLCVGTNENILPLETHSSAAETRWEPGTPMMKTGVSWELESWQKFLENLILP